MTGVFMTGDSEKRSRETGNETPVAVKLVPVKGGELTEVVELTGTLFGNEEATISAKVKGRLTQHLVDVGDRVKPGQILAEIDRKDYEIAARQMQAALSEALAEIGLTALPDAGFEPDKVPAVERARLEERNAGTQFERARRLFTQKPPLITEQDFADLETQYEVKKRDYQSALLQVRSRLALVHTRTAELEAAKQALEDSYVRAPAGEAANDTAIYAVARRLISPGEYVKEGDPLFDLIWDDPLKLRAAVPERFFPVIRVGQLLGITVEGLTEPIQGELTRISPSIALETRTFEIEGTVPNLEHRLLAGAFARATVAVGTTSVRFVPKASVLSFAGVDRVFSVSEGKVREHVVVRATGRNEHEELGDLIAVDRGIEGVSEVVAERVSQLAAGQAVTVQR